MSLNQRIILSATLVLAIFITLTAAALDRAFFDSTESALRDRLTSQLYALMAAAEVDERGISMPSNELDALLGLPSSGVYAQVTNADAKVMWRSSSALGATPPSPVSLPSGKKHFDRVQSDSNEFYRMAYGVSWALDNHEQALTFNISSDVDSFNKQIEEYRTTLWGWLLAMAVLLLVSQALILRWGLLPLRRVGSELNRIETGEQEQIEHEYPREISRLTQNINLLLQQERQQKTRYRNALGDLAHSLKTPLAVLQGGLKHQADGDNLQEQITRMNSIVEYQLQRAATAGSSAIGKAVDITQVLDRMLDSLQKVYRDKSIEVQRNVAPKLIFRGDEGDLMELLGNLLDNAYKWANRQIEVNAEKQGNRIIIRVLDDGPGIAADKVEELLQRGKRADQSVAGHGIGLSIVCNIVEAYNGELRILRSSLGGAEIQLVL